MVLRLVRGFFLRSTLWRPMEGALTTLWTCSHGRPASAGAGQLHLKRGVRGRVCCQAVWGQCAACASSCQACPGACQALARAPRHC